MANHTRMGEDYCPTCGHLNDAATALNSEAVPDPGDITVCFYCGSINKFGADMALERVTLEEIQDLPDHLLQNLSVVQQSIFERNGKIGP